MAKINYYPIDEEVMKQILAKSEPCQMVDDKYRELHDSCRIAKN